MKVIIINAADKNNEMVLIAKKRLLPNSRLLVSEINNDAAGLLEFIKKLPHATVIKFEKLWQEHQRKIKN